MSLIERGCDPLKNRPSGRNLSRRPICLSYRRGIFVVFWYNSDMNKNAKFIFVIGIGGSDLTSKAVWNALTAHKPEVEKKIFFLESPDSREYKEVTNFVKTKIKNLEDIALVVISKSGNTAETLESFHKIFDILSEKFGSPLNKRVLIISSPNSPLWKLAEEKEIEKIEWEGDKKITDYFKYIIKVDFNIIGLKNVEVQREGGKIQTNKGSVEINMKGILVSDYEGKYDTSPTLRFFRGVYEKWIIPSTIEQIEEKLAGIIENRFFVAVKKDKILGEKMILIIEELKIDKIKNSTKALILSEIKNSKLFSTYEIPKEIYFLEKFIETETKKIDRAKTLEFLKNSF